MNQVSNNTIVDSTLHCYSHHSLVRTQEPKPSLMQCMVVWVSIVGNKGIAIKPFFCAQVWTPKNFHIYPSQSLSGTEPYCSQKHNATILFLLPLFAYVAFALCLLFHCSLPTTLRSWIWTKIFASLGVLNREQFPTSKLILWISILIRFMTYWDLERGARWDVVWREDPAAIAPTHGHLNLD